MAGSPNEWARSTRQLLAAAEDVAAALLKE
jgi:hypothetical protein